MHILIYFSFSFFFSFLCGDWSKTCLHTLHTGINVLLFKWEEELKRLMFALLEMLWPCSQLHNVCRQVKKTNGRLIESGSKEAGSDQWGCRWEHELFVCVCVCEVCILELQLPWEFGCAKSNLYTHLKKNNWYTAFKCSKNYNTNSF